jgi:hypothetical protein
MPCSSEDDFSSVADKNFKGPSLWRIFAPILSDCSSLERMELLPYLVEIFRAINAPQDKGFLGADGIKVALFLRMVLGIYCKIRPSFLSSLFGDLIQF